MNRIFSKCDSIVDTFFKRSLSHRRTGLVGVAGGTGGYIFGPWVAKYWRGSNCCHYLRQKNKSPLLQSSLFVQETEINVHLCDKTIIIIHSVQQTNWATAAGEQAAQRGFHSTKSWWTVAKLEYMIGKSRKKERKRNEIRVTMNLQTVKQSTCAAPTYRLGRPAGPWP